MRKFAVLAAVAAAAVASPALAGEGRVEARGGIAWVGGASEAIAGVAAGYDFDLGDKGFAGVEVSGDKLLVGGTDVIFGLTGRLGGKIGENTKLFAAAGYSFGEGDAAHIGAGLQHKFGSRFYGKVEYRLFLNDGPNINTAAVGLGMAF